MVTLVTLKNEPATESFVKDILSNKVDPEPALNDSWALWVMASQQGRVGKEHWQASQTKAHEINTVAEFWRLHNSIHSASNLCAADYSLFRRGVCPAWEDPSFRSGGRFIAKVSTFIDESWLNVQLALIGEAFNCESRFVCGAVFSSRRGGSKIALWLSTCDLAVLSEAERAFKACIISDNTQNIAFESFSHGTTAEHKV